MDSFKNIITSNNAHLFLYYVVCAFSYCFFILTFFYKRNKMDLKTILTNKVDFLVYSIFFFCILLVVYLSIFVTLNFLFLAIIFWCMFSFIVIFFYLTIRYKDKYLSERLKPVSRICPECHDINNKLNDYIKKTKIEDIYTSSNIQKQLSSYKESSIKLLLEEIISYKDSQSSINFSVIFLLLGILVGKFFENSYIESRDLDGLIIALIITLIFLVVVFTRYMTYFILYSIEIEDTVSIKINLLKKHLYS